MLLIGTSEAVFLGSKRKTAGDSSAAAAPPPMDKAYADADDVAKFIEKRRGAPFFPEGSDSRVDMSASYRKEMEAVFGETPDIFSKCVLVRDFAEPLRVGSAIMKTYPGNAVT